MTAPQILARSDMDDLGFKPDSRSASTLVREVRIPYEGGAVGEVLIGVFKSTSSEDRGGLAIRITIRDEGQSFIPYAKLIDGGIEIHIAGDIESKVVADALRQALAEVPK